MKKYILFILLAFCCNSAFAKNKQIDSLQYALQTAKEDTNKVNILNKLSDNLSNDSPASALKYGQFALQLAQKLYWKKGEAGADNNIGQAYYGLPGPNKLPDYAKVIAYFQLAIKIDSEIGYKSWPYGEAVSLINLGETYEYNILGHSKALNCYQRALKIYCGSGDKPGEASCLYRIGDVYFDLSDYNHAVDFYQQALKIERETGDKEREAYNLLNLGNVYSSLSEYPIALDFYQQSLKKYRDIGNKKGEGDILTNIGNLYIKLSDYPRALDYTQQSLKIHREISYKYAQAVDLANIALIYKNLSDYPHAIEYLRQGLEISTGIGNKHQEAICLDNFGEVYEKMTDYPQALDYFRQALKINKEIGDKNDEAANLDNIGGVYYLMSDFPNALDYEQQGLGLAKEIGALDWQRSAYEQMSKVYEKTKQPEKSLEAFKQYIAIRDSVINVDKQKAITRKSMQFDFDMKEAAAKAEQDKKDAVVRIQRYSFMGGGILLLLLLGLAVNRYRFENKAKKTIAGEKQRSDELLLNILPSETAEELKKYGKASAKSYDEVTVLFADIKGFTIISEKLGPDVLVKELDTYFQAFDNVVHKYGLEKIKTIGDAYLCVGGLPVPDAQAPEKVINAALDILKHLAAVKAEKAPKNEPYFEIRVGVHTGPCVAGVVGIKKFAYDIWGDTVNTAARMEQNSEPGKINISETTYQLVKDKFNCTYRGLIEAKNKGEIKMYFVEGGYMIN